MDSFEVAIKTTTWIEEVEEAIDDYGEACERDSRCDRGASRQTRNLLLHLITRGRCPECGWGVCLPTPLQVACGTHSADVYYCGTCGWKSKE